MKNLSVAKKLIIAFSVILILFVTTITLGFFKGLKSITTSFDTFYKSPYTATNAINNMRRQMQGMQKDMAYILLDDPANRQTWIG